MVTRWCFSDISQVSNLNINTPWAVRMHKLCYFMGNYAYTDVSKPFPEHPDPFCLF